MADNLEKRAASDFSPLPDADTASEIRPVIRSLNGLFSRVAAAREHERNFTAFAAHELRTPMAGLKTQAQIALGSHDNGIRDNALRQIVVGVDRTSRLVRQLTDLAAAGAGDAEPRACIDVGHHLQLLADELHLHTPQRASLVVDTPLHGLQLRVEPTLFMLAARNLMENALLHSPQDGVVRCWTRTQDRIVSIVIDDDGPGIPEDELPKVRDRFFRGRHKTPVGSGLGLAIVDDCLTRAGAVLTLSNRAEGGLRAVIRMRVDANGDVMEAKVKMARQHFRRDNIAAHCLPKLDSEAIQGASACSD